MANGADDAGLSLHEARIRAVEIVAMRTAVESARERVQCIPVTDETVSLRARALQALDDLADELGTEAVEPLRERVGRRK